MGYDPWVDSELRGGQDWWEEVLRRIADSDVFIAIISPAALSSTACRREVDWAEALARPMLPVAVEPTPAALPGRFARRQIVDYSQPQQRERAALMLQGGLGSVPAAPPLPDPLPEPPAAPLSYLTVLVDLVTHHKPLDHAQQHQILQQLGAALRSVDPEERRGGQDILERFASRADVYADVDRTISALRQLADEASRVDVREAADVKTVQPDSLAKGFLQDKPTTAPRLPSRKTPERLSRRVLTAAGAVLLVLALSAVGVWRLWPGRGESALVLPEGAIESIAATVPDDIRKTGRLVIGVNVPYAPNEFKNSQGQIVGFDVDLMNTITRTLGLTPDYRETAFEAIMPWVAAGKLNVGTSSITDTKEREADVDFVNYFEAGTLWAQRTGSGVDPANACGLRIGVTYASIQETEEIPAKSDACKTAGMKPIEKKVYDRQDDLTAALMAGEVDAMAADSPVTGFAIRLSGGKLAPAGHVFDSAPYGWPVAKGSALAESLRQALEHLMQTGEYRTIAAMWGVELGTIDKPKINGAIQ
jgi:ABC-type amino acid transport substrate-binding protein